MCSDIFQLDSAELSETDVETEEGHTQSVIDEVSWHFM